MRNKNTPQENKILDYVNQSRNSYGENDKSSRKAIRNRKASVNRDFRREGRNILRSNEFNSEVIDVQLSEQERINWKKCPDESLVEHISDYNRNELTSELQKEAARRIKKSKRDSSL